MDITCNHSASSYGIPVILDDNGKLMDYPEGMTHVLSRLGWSRKDLAHHCGGKSLRSVDRYWLGQAPPATVLNVLSVCLVRLDED